MLHYCHQSPSRSKNVSELHECLHNKWWDMHLRIWFGNETLIFAVHVAGISKTKQSVSVHSKVSFSLHGTQCLLWICPRRSTVNHHPCVKVLKRLGLDILRMMPKKQNSCAWAVQNDKAPSHISHSVVFFFLANHVMPVVQEKLYSLTWLLVTSRCSPQLK